MNTKQIPKIIHYCWFGKTEKPDYAKKYIESWKAKMPDYKFMEWNEDNFNINYCDFSAEAYSMKKYAFVSDVARLYALYNYGGIYLDTDVEILKSFDDIVDNKCCIFGYELGNKIATSFMASEKNFFLIQQFLEMYVNKNFIGHDGSLNEIPNVVYLTNLLKENGLIENGEFQKLDNDIYVYPSEFFSPYDYVNCKNDNTVNTYCIHHFIASWMDKKTIIKKKIKTILVRIIGRKNLIYLRSIKNSIRK